MKVDGLTVLVTGAGVRVGREIAIALAECGARIGVHCNSSKKQAEETLDAIRGAGSQGEIFQADLTVEGSADRLIGEVVARFGALDVLVNSAAVMQRTPFGEVTVAEWDAMFALNLRAPFFLSQAAAAAMGDRGGAIVNISDLAAFETWPAFIPHGISKAGVVQMTRALARSLAPRVRVNAIAPGAVMLPDGWNEESEEHIISTTPLKRLGSPKDVAEAVIYLIQADYVTGITLIVDGGRHIRT
ncbi:MAG: SDR family oxidoreductase [Gemmatimonadaceae bacterium]|nr:SDR family oxidoreductase [Gemmatimonadaceae bacterium]